MNNDHIQTPELKKEGSNLSIGNWFTPTQAQILGSPMTPKTLDILSTRGISRGNSPYPCLGCIGFYPSLSPDYFQDRLISPNPGQFTPILFDTFPDGMSSKGFTTPITPSRNSIISLSSKILSDSDSRIGCTISSNLMEMSPNSLNINTPDSYQAQDSRHENLRISNYDQAFLRQVANHANKTNKTNYSDICSMVFLKESNEKKQNLQNASATKSNSSLRDYSRKASQRSEDTSLLYSSQENESFQDGSPFPATRTLQESGLPTKPPMKTISLNMSLEESPYNQGDAYGEKNQAEKDIKKEEDLPEEEDDTYSEDSNNDEDYEESLHPTRKKSHHSLETKAHPNDRDNGSHTTKANQSTTDSMTSPTSSESTRVHCNCRRSRCLKLYCECFARQLLCENCICKDCHNTKFYTEAIEEAQKLILARDPNAFTQKIVENSTHSAFYHSKGCNCKKSNCTKKYCECFQAGIPCGATCKCKDCYNRDSGEKKGKRTKTDSASLKRQRL